MTDKKKDLTDEQLEGLIAEGFAGEMIPTDPQEVDRAEAELAELSGDLDLPPLRERSAQSSGALSSEAGAPEGSPLISQEEGKVVSLSAARKIRAPVWQLGASALLGAAAAALLMSVFLPTPQGPDVGAAGGEIVADPRSGPEPEKSPPVKLSVPCEDCCGGPECSQQKQECASGRRCVSCSSGPLDQYRLRLGHLSWAEKQLLPDPNSGELVSPEPNPIVCVTAGREPEMCLGETDQAPQPWYQTPGAFTASQMQNQLVISLRRRRDKALLGVWKRELALSSGILCKGVVVELADAADVPVAQLSLFIDDAQYVEIARSESVRALLQVRDGLAGDRTEARVHQLTTGDFVLAVGPLSGSQAEAVRWQLLEGGMKPKVTTSTDYIWGFRPD